MNKNISKLQIGLSIFLFFSSVNFHAQSVKASQYGFGEPSNALTRAFNSEFDTIVIDVQDEPWLLKPIRFKNLEGKVIILEKGLMMKALPGAFPRTNDALLTFTDCDNITIIGNDSQLKMNKAEYTEGEWRHGISLRGCEDFKICDLEVRDTGGDGIYIAGSKRRVASKNIYIDRVRAINNRRQGMTIISAENVIVENSLFEATSGTRPSAGIDIEPNKTIDIIDKIRVSNCTFRNNYGPGIMLAFGKLDNKSKPIDILFEECVLEDNYNEQRKGVGTEIRLSANKDSPVKGFVVFENCLVENSKWGLLYSRKRADAYKVIFNDCTLKDTSLNGESSTIYLEVPDYYSTTGPLGGYEFNGLHLENQSDVSFMTIRGSRLGTLQAVRDITASIIWNKSNREAIEYINYNPKKNLNVELEFITEH